ncbi:hypothetical protein NESM_000639600 [Novymonas esmeraldas]|uniref:Uncharacterized protein n=1 Tax=Novymonas esmeraldas TaxID=1808958 RepID=A0AAW0ETA1_9TRYP
MDRVRESVLQPAEEGLFVCAARQLKSAEAQEALARVYACATVYTASQSADAAAASAGEAAAVQAMERIVGGASSDLAADLALAEDLQLWRARKVVAQAQVEADTAGLRARLLDLIRADSPPECLSSAPQPPPTAAASMMDERPPDTSADATAAVAVTLPSPPPPLVPEQIAECDGVAETIAAPSPTAATAAATPPAEEKENVDAALTASCATRHETKARGDAPSIHASTDIMSEARNAEDRNNMNTAGLDAAVSAAPCTHEPKEGGNTSPTRSASSRAQEEAEAEAQAGATESTTSSPCLPPAPAADVSEAAAVSTANARLLCFEECGLRFTDADFRAAAAGVRSRRSAGVEAAADADGSSTLAAGHTTAAAAAAAPPSPPPRSVEDAGLHYVRRQLPVRHLQPFASPLKALARRLAEGDSAAAAPHDPDGGDTASQLADPLMARLHAELAVVCEEQPVANVRVRPDALVYRRERGQFTADEARVELNVVVTPISGPMAGESVHVRLRVPAGYPFVAPRAHLAVDVPHRRCTGVAVDRVPRLITLFPHTAASASASASAAAAVKEGDGDGVAAASAPRHPGEAERLRPLTAAVNSGWDASMTVRDVLVALAGLFNAEEFAETARTLHNDALMQTALQRARVQMYEDEEEHESATRVVAALLDAGVATPPRQPRRQPLSPARRGERGGAAHLQSRSSSSSVVSGGGGGNVDEQESTGEDSLGMTASAEEDSAGGGGGVTAHLLMCNGPFLTKADVAAPASAPSLIAAQISVSPSTSTEPSADRVGQVGDVVDDEETSETRSPSQRAAAARRRQRKPLQYTTADSGGVVGPWSGCWGHLLVSTAAPASFPAVAAVTTAAAAVAASHGGPHTGADVAAASQHRLPLAHGASRQRRGARESGGALYVRLKHHHAGAGAATLHLVRVAASTLRELPPSPSSPPPSLPPSPQRRPRKRPATVQSAWAAALLSAVAPASAPPGTVWSSSAPYGAESEVLVCIHEDAAPSSKDATPHALESTLPTTSLPQRVSLRDVGHDEEDRGEDGAGGERCYALVLDVPAGQQVSVVFSSDERACLSVLLTPSSPATTSTDAAAARREGWAAMAGLPGAGLGRWPAAATRDGDARGVLVELPYEDWQFHATPSAVAAARGATKEEDVHAHWPRTTRFHGAGAVLPITMHESAFHMYQLLQNALLGNHAHPLHGCLLAGAAFTRVRQAYAATRAAVELEAATRRYAFWGWRNLFLPFLSSETVDVVQAALRTDSDARRGGVTSAAQMAKALRPWEVAVLERFGLACVQLHRDPDASTAYRAPFQASAVLRTLALTVSYALEVLQQQQQQQQRQSSAEAAACEDADDKGQWESVVRRSLERCLSAVVVLSVALAAVKPAYLALCVAVAAPPPSPSGAESSGVEGARGREVRHALSQLSSLQCSAVRVLASSTAAAYPAEVQQLQQEQQQQEQPAVVDEASAACPDATEASGPPLSLADRVEALLNTPESPVSANGGDSSAGLTSRVAALLRLIAASA